MRVLSVAALVAIAVAVPVLASGGGDDPPRSGHVVVQTDRSSFSVPAGWYVAGSRYTDLAFPRERLLAASYRLPRPGKRSSCGPMAAVQAIPPKGALVFVFEYTRTRNLQRAEFKPRPRRFSLPRGEQQPFECVGPSHLLTFRDHGRFFQAHIALGRSADPREALRILDSLRLG